MAGTNCLFRQIALNDELLSEDTEDMASNFANQVTAVQLQSRLDVHTVAWLSQQVEQLKASKQAMWVFDMAQVDFLDSQGLVSLVEARHAACEANAQLVLCSVKRPIQMIFDLAQLDQVFAIVDTMEALPVLMTQRVSTEADLGQVA